MTPAVLDSPADRSLLRRVADGLDPQPDPWASDPVGWVHHKGEETWSGQDRILESIRDNRYTAVESAHSTGKSHIASRAIGWWVDSHPMDDLFVVTTAPSTNQVAGILWRYVRALHKKVGLPGYITGGDVPQWKVGDQQLIGWGRKPQDLANAEEAATVFQGIHARFVLVVLDEAGGIPEWLWNAVDTLVTSPNNRVLAIGNPDDPSSHFEKICRPGSGWNVQKISAFDTPAYTGEDVSEELLEVLVSPEWVEERKERWGEDSPLYISKVLAEFPEVSDDNLIPVGWIKRAMEADYSGTMIGDAGKWVMDVARSGQDETTLGRLRGQVFRIEKAKRGIGDLMTNVAWLSTANRDVPAAKIIVDADGLGSGVFDRARELRLPVSAFFAGRRAFNPRKFKNRRSEQWWAVRELFQADLFDIDALDEDLQSQLGSIKWSEDSSGRIIVETKKELKRRGLPSPDRGDTLMMSTAPADDWTDVYAEEGDAVGYPREPETITGDLLTKNML